MASERAAEVTSAEAAAAKTSANCDSRDSTRALQRAEVEGPEGRTEIPVLQGRGVPNNLGPPGL